MIALYYQFAIPITLLLAYLISKKSKKVIIIVAGIWGIWTLINVPYPPLNYLQFGNILISYFLITKIFTNFRNKDQEIEKEKKRRIDAEKRVDDLEKNIIFN